MADTSWPYFGQDPASLQMMQHGSGLGSPVLMGGQMLPSTSTGLPLSSRTRNAPPLHLTHAQSSSNFIELVTDFSTKLFGSKRLTFTVSGAPCMPPGWLQQQQEQLQQMQQDQATASAIFPPQLPPVPFNPFSSFRFVYFL